MSQDAAALAALSTKTRSEISYFELVVLRFSGQAQPCFLCVGRHAIFLVRRSLGGLYPSEQAGEVRYAHVERILEDSQSWTDFLIVMGKGRPTDWQDGKLFVVSEHRVRLLDQLTVAWQTDHACRLGKVGKLSRSKHALRQEPQSGLLQVRPFKGYQQVVHEGYSFLLPDSYIDRAGSAHSNDTTVFVDEKREMEVTLHVTEPVPLADLEANGRDHVRWVALEGNHILRERHHPVVVVRNAFRLKKMNLTNDLACWTGWELYLKTRSSAIFTMFLRRQFVPPMMDAAQDITVTVTCSLHLFSDGILNEQEVLQEACMAADSAAPLAGNCTVYQTLYRDMIQAKLDALLYSEEALTWLQSSLSLRPAPEQEARVFLKSVLKILQEENALTSPTLLNEIGDAIPIELDPMNVPRQMQKKFPGGGSMSEEVLGSNDPLANAWIARVARYFAHCVDGVLLGKQFTIHELTGPSLVTRLSRQRIEEVISFILHLRPKDMTRAYVPMDIRELLHDPKALLDYTFNERIMQSLLEWGWLAKRLSNSTEGYDSISLDYAKLLSQLLMLGSVSVNLKAAICRQLMAVSKGRHQHFSVILPALVGTLHHHSLYLKTYATVTLVNMTGGEGKETAQNTVMGMDVTPICIEHIRAAVDDDLTRYTLLLLTNLSKSAHHRNVMQHHGAMKVVKQMLSNCPAMPSKFEMLAELVSVIGQFCNDDTMWHEFCDGVGSGGADRLLELFYSSPPGSKLRSKMMFALRQVCSRQSFSAPSSVDKLVIGEVIPSVVADLADSAEEIKNGSDVDLDSVTNGIFLLCTLSMVKDNVKKMSDLELDSVLSQLMMSRLGRMDSTRDRLQQLLSRVASHPRMDEEKKNAQGSAMVSATRRSTTRQ
mmetsp:Transcript_38985/g.84860  ORF Transcript_38985/g.84860 Transcript_38985/m.84860 type:complete len:881 (+) Transcript_38985:160-2802(+)